MSVPACLPQWAQDRNFTSTEQVPQKTDVTWRDHYCSWLEISWNAQRPQEKRKESIFASIMFNSGLELGSTGILPQRPTGIELGSRAFFPQSCSIPVGGKKCPWSQFNPLRQEGKSCPFGEKFGRPNAALHGVTAVVFSWHPRRKSVGWFRYERFIEILDLHVYIWCFLDFFWSSRSSWYHSEKPPESWSKWIRKCNDLASRQGLLVGSWTWPNEGSALASRVVFLGGNCSIFLACFE